MRQKSDHVVQLHLSNEEYHRLVAKKHICGFSLWNDFIQFICDSDFLLPNGRTTSHRNTSYQAAPRDFETMLKDLNEGATINFRTPEDRIKLQKTEKKMLYILDNAAAYRLPKDMIRKVENLLEATHQALQDGY